MYCHPAYLTYMQSASCEMLGQVKHKPESSSLGENAGSNINNLRYSDDTTLMAESKELELKSLLMKVKEESEKAGLKLSIQKNNIMASGLITSGIQIGEQCKQRQTLFSWTPKSLWMVAAAMKLKTLASWKKNYDKPRQSIKKKSHHSASKSAYSQSYGFPSSHVDMRVGPQRRLNADELMLLNCGVGEDSWESLVLQGDQISHS